MYGNSNMDSSELSSGNLMHAPNQIQYESYHSITHSLGVEMMGPNNINGGGGEIIYDQGTGIDNGNGLSMGYGGGGDLHYDTSQLSHHNGGVYAGDEIQHSHSHSGNNLSINAMNMNAMNMNGLDSSNDEEVMGTFSELTRVFDSYSAVTAICSDPEEELIWVGYENGRITSFFHQPTGLAKYSSVQAHDSDIRTIKVHSDFGVFSVSANSIRLHNRGCKLLIALDDLLMSEDETTAIEEFTASVFNTSNGFMKAGGYSTTYVTIGTNFGRLFQFDLSESLNLLQTLSIPCGVNSLACDRFLVVGGEDGKLRLMDSTLRKNKVEKVLDAHTGPVTGICCKDDVMVTCGLVSRSLNPYDKKSPTHYYPDHLIKVFDLRVMRQLAPLSFSTAMLGSPSLLHFLPANSSYYGSSAADGHLLLIGSSVGQLILYDMSGDGTCTEYFQVVGETGQPDSLACLDVSQSGDILAMGSSEGMIIQWGTHMEAIINPASRQSAIPEFQPPAPPISIGINEVEQSASKYVIRPKALYPYFVDSPLSSSFPNCEWVLSLPLVPPPKRTINPSLKAKITQSDFLGYVPNTTYGFIPNSLLYGSGKEAYVVSDPRRRGVNANGGDLNSHHNGSGSGGLGSSNGRSQSFSSVDYLGHGDAVPRRYRHVKIDFSKRGLDGFDFGKYNKTPFAGLENLLPHSYTNAALQMLYFVPEVRLSMLRHQFDPDNYGNEKSLMCELGFLYHMLDQAKTAKSNVKSCQASKLIQLFKQIQEAVALGLLDKTSKLKQRIETFHRFLLQTLHAEYSALIEIKQQGKKRKGYHSNYFNNATVSETAIIDSYSAGTGVTTAAEQKINIEDSKRDNNSKSLEIIDVIDELYGYTITTSNMFLISNSYSPSSEARAFVVELVYPRQAPWASDSNKDTSAMGNASSASANSTPAPPVSNASKESPATKLPFCQVLYSSLCREEKKTRGWCEETQAYEPLLQRRTPTTLPKLLTVHCSVSAGGGGNVAQELWHSTNILGGGWVPEKVNLCLGSNEAGSRLVVQEKLHDPEDAPEAETWVSYDGAKIEKTQVLIKNNTATESSSRDTNKDTSNKLPEADKVLLPTGGEAKYDSNDNITDGKSSSQSSITLNYELVACVSYVGKHHKDDEEHLILHVKVPRDYDERSKHGRRQSAVINRKRTQPSVVDDTDDNSKTTEEKNEGKEAIEEANVAEDEEYWLIFNDFLVEETILADVLGFSPDWKEPCILLYRSEGCNIDFGSLLPINSVIPTSVYDTPSLAVTPTEITKKSFSCIPPSQLPGPGDVIAIDAEFVAVEIEKAHISSDGSRVLRKEGRQTLARVSVIDTRCELCIIDDYVVPSEPVVDYLTRFSGLTKEDLDPATSHHHMVTARTAYLKLRYLIDRGCVFLGHGLKKDFRTINIYVPPEQVIDTVDLWALEHQRKISLRFLASYLLGHHIQSETHDSIEDARTALLLYRKYLEHKEAGTFEEKLNEIYAFGRQHNWHITASRN